MNSYQKEQSEAFSMVRRHLSGLSASDHRALKRLAKGYLSFRSEADAFLSEYFGKVCTQKCYESRLSACCSREGIITFFADVVINTLFSQGSEIEDLLAVLRQSNAGFKCIYLGKRGCMWRIKQIVCEMFLCGQAKNQVFEESPHAGQAWENIKQREKEFTWPDRPVIFDELESYFIHAGYSSPIMYMHNSPGLLKVKKQAKVTRQCSRMKGLHGED